MSPAVRIRLPLTALLSLPLAFALAACTPSASPAPGGTATPGATQAAAVACTTSGSDASVAIADFSYTPAQAAVSVGQAVQWTNDGQAAHTVTFEDGPDCGSVSSGGTVSASFGVAGTYDYVCTFHSNMRGTVQVNP